VGLTEEQPNPLGEDPGFSGWPELLNALVGGRTLREDEARAVLHEILEGRSTPAQVSSLLTALAMRPPTVDEMVGFVRAMLDLSEVVEAGSDALDTCGTGGDRSGTFNVSTAAGLVAAGAGCKVCKHGNRAASSKAGSADVLEALGVAVDLGPTGVARCIEEAGMGFCFAPRFHLSMRHAAPVRKEIGIPTVFNYLGPLANPARVAHQLIGVSNPEMMPKMLGVLDRLGSRKVIVVHGSAGSGKGGLDEVSTLGPTQVSQLARGPSGEARISTYELDPVSLGFRQARLEDLRGADPQENASLVKGVLQGRAGPALDIVVLNAAFALLAAERVPGDRIEDAIALAYESIESGRALEALDALVRVSQECKKEGL